MSKNVVVCLDGTRNEPERGSTNVARLYDIALKGPQQAVYYDPGVGTMGARSATTRAGQALTRSAGLVLGHGVKENVEEAYTFLMRNWEPGDRIYVFGFSRGAYTALALVGMLRTVGLLRPGTENLVPYALKLYAKGGKEKATPAEEQAFWQLRQDFSDVFAEPRFPDRFAGQIDFLGIWDAVKSVGWFNWRASLQQARWPFTRKVPNVLCGRHALSLDERRRPYAPYRFDQRELEKGRRLREVWFAGVHSDVGGNYPDDHRLSDIALQWMVDEAMAEGFVIDPVNYRKHLPVAPGEELPEEWLQGRVHPNHWSWFLAGFGWHRRQVRPGDEIHPSAVGRRSGAPSTSGQA